MAGIPLTVTAIPAFPTHLPSNVSSFLPPIVNSPHGGWNGPPDDLIVVSARRINSILPSLITASMALGLVVSDWSIHLPWEWQLLRTRKKWKLSYIAYFASRIGGLGFSIAALLHSVVGNVAAGPMELGEARWDYANFACRADKMATTIFSVISIAGSSGILLLRCLALYRFNIFAVVFLGTLWLATPALLIVNTVNLSSRSRRNGLSACDPVPPSLHINPVISYMPWFFLPIFDSAILILSLIGLHRASHRRRASPLERMFRKDNIVYYAIVFLCVIPIPVWYIAQGRDGRMMPYLNLYIGLSSILSCRLFINLWKAIGRELALAHTFDNHTRDHRPVGSTSMQNTSDDLVSPQLSRRITALSDNDLPTEQSATDVDSATASSTAADEKTSGQIAETTEYSARSSASLQSRHVPRYARVVPDWADVDPDLAFSLNGDYFANTLDTTYQSRALHSTPY